MRVAVTGGAGFIGSHFVDKCVEEGWDVRFIDNCRTGRFAGDVLANPKLQPGQELTFLRFDIVKSEMDELYNAFDGCDWVAHFAANADVRYGFDRPYFDIEQNIIGTHRVLEGMRGVGCKNIFFASTASVYGDAYSGQFGIGEECGMPRQQSLYGMSKQAAEGMISAYVEGFGFNSVIGRWVQIIGERYLHGHVIDFVRKLQRNQDELEILGSGHQRKSGLYVKDLARGIFDAITYQDEYTHPQHKVFNFGTDQTFTVFESAELICKLMQVTPKLVPQVGIGVPYAGWVGDNPNVLLDSSRAKEVLGWEPFMGIPEAILITARWLLSDECRYL